MGNHYEKNTYKLLFVKILHLLVSVALFYVVWLYFRYEGLTITVKTGFRYNYLVAVGYGVLLFWFNKTYNSYLFGYTRIRLLVFGQILSQLFSIVIVYIVVSVSWSRFRSPLTLIPILLIPVQNSLKRSVNGWRTDFEEKSITEVQSALLSLVSKVLCDPQTSISDHELTEPIIKSSSDYLKFHQNLDQIR